MSKKLLFVSIAFPPKNDPECAQTGRYAYYLKKDFNWDITVVTSKIPTLFMPYDASLERFSKDFKKIEVQIFESKLINKIISFLSQNLLSKPDSKYSFYKQWKKVIRQFNKPDIIYSRSFPLSSTLMALKLKGYYRVPWIMHLSDPWVESPLHNMTSDYHKNAERLSFEKADLISFTTVEAMHLYKEKYPALKEKFFVNTNVFEPSLNAPKNLDKKTNEIKIVYTGGLANTRNAKFFLNALKIASEKQPEVLKLLKVIFAGDMDSNNRKYFESLNYMSNVQHLGILSQMEAKKLQSTADLLLVIDSKITDIEKNVFLPSKILDYAAQNKAILAITEKNSPSARFLKAYGGISFSFEEEELLADYLIELANNPALLNQEKLIPKEYAISNQVEILNRKLLSLL
jgi:glycosyltransferase involved in cell wall biosynthesis